MAPGETSERAVMALEVDSRIEPPVNRCVVQVGHAPGGRLKVAPGDQVRVHLGFRTPGSDEVKTALVYTGEVVEVESGVTETVVEGLSRSHRFLVSRADTVYNATTHDDVIKKLAKLVDVEVAPDGVQPSQLKRSRYVVSSQTPIYDLLRRLALEGGMDLITDQKGRLVARAFDPGSLAESGDPADAYAAINDGSAGAAKHVLTVGKEVIHVELDRLGPTVKGLDFANPSDYGSDAETQLKVARVEGASEYEQWEAKGRAEGRRINTLFPWEDKETASKAAQNLVIRSNPPLVRGLVRVIGRPEVRVGDGIVLRGRVFGGEGIGTFETRPADTDATFSWSASEKEGGGSGGEGGGSEEVLEVMGVRHIVDRSHGFVTELTVARWPAIPMPEPELEEAEEEEKTPTLVIDFILHAADGQTPLRFTKYRLESASGKRFEGTTNAEGRVYQEVPGDEEYKLQLFDSQFQVGVEQQYRPEPGPALGLNLQLLDEQGVPLAGRRYTVEIDGSEVASGVTDEDGMLKESNLPEGTCTVKVGGLRGVVSTMDAAADLYILMLKSSTSESQSA